MSSGLILPAVLAFSGLVAVVAGLGLGMGTSAVPGSGAWPVVVGLALTLFGLAAMLDRMVPLPVEHRLQGQLRVVGAVLTMALLYRPAGLIVAALAAGALLSGVFPGAARRWSVAASGLSALGLWLILSAGLDVPVRLGPPWLLR